MAYLNKVLLMGNLTREPQSKALQQNGTPICDFGMAVNRRYKTQSGEEREDVVYIDLTAYGYHADYCVKNMTKGSTVYVEGHLRFDSWQDKDTGKNRSKLRVVVDNIYHLDRKSSQMPDQPYPAYGQAPQPYGYQSQPYPAMPPQQAYQPYAQPVPAYAQHPQQQAIPPLGAVPQPSSQQPVAPPSAAASTVQAPPQAAQPAPPQPAAIPVTPSSAAVQPPAEPADIPPANPPAPQNDEVVDDMPF